MHDVEPREHVRASDRDRERGRFAKVVTQER